MLTLANARTSFVCARDPLQAPLVEEQKDLLVTRVDRDVTQQVRARSTERRHRHDLLRAVVEQYEGVA